MIKQLPVAKREREKRERGGLKINKDIKEKEALAPYGLWPWSSTTLLHLHMYYIYWCGLHMPVLVAAFLSREMHAELEHKKC